jgi:hypothetical protein
MDTSLKISHQSYSTWETTAPSFFHQLLRLLFFTRPISGSGLRLLSSTPRRTNLPRARLDWVQKVIKLEHINPSPYQRRRYFDQDKLKELAASIQREGLIEPIVVRPVRKRYELIAGERRLRAIRDYTEMKTIQAQVIKSLHDFMRRGLAPRKKEIKGNSYTIKLFM